MEYADRATVATGKVSGPFFKESIVCQYKNMIRPIGGMMHGQDPLDYTFPVLLIQISLIFIFTRFIYFLVKHLRQSMLNAEILAGFLLGPSVLWYYFPPMKNLFPSGGKVILTIVADMGAILHLFILALQMDTSIIKEARITEAVLAVTGFMFPLTIGWYTFSSMVESNMLDETVAKFVPPILIVNSWSSFGVITGLLSDLKILNSELGRFASRISMINDMSCFILGQVIAARQVYVHASAQMALKYIISFLILLIFIFCILKPIILRVSRYAKYGEPMEDIHIFVVILSVLSCSLVSEVVGQHYLFGPFILGASLPDGPPLGAEVEFKLHTFIRGILVPVFTAISGLNINVFATRTLNYSGLKVIVAATYIAKFTSLLLPALFCGLQFPDALCLALILSYKGIVEVAVYVSWKDSQMLDANSFNILLISLLIVGAFTRPLISLLYDPSKKYKTSNRRTIRGANYHSQLRVLVCIHSTDNVPMIVSLLKACNPTKYSPITVFVLHLMKLTGRASSILVPHERIGTVKTAGNCSLQIFNAFERLQHQFQGCIVIQHFTAVAPYKSMHTDICTIASEKRTTIVIMPYHKNWSVDGTIGSLNTSIRIMNHNVTEMAPCSVGLLIDRGHCNRRILFEHSLYRVAMFFFGGDDDSEALAISGRIASHSNVSLTIFIFKHELYDYSEKEKALEQWLENLEVEDGKENDIQIKEVVVNNGEETIKEICSLGDSIDFAIVGRHQDPRSPITMGLTEWSEGPELGVIGEMLSSWDFKFSVLVVAQQPLPSEPDLKSVHSSKSLNSVVSSSNLSKDDEWKPIVNYI